MFGIKVHCQGYLTTQRNFILERERLYDGILFRKEEHRKYLIPWINELFTLTNFYCSCPGIFLFFALIQLTAVVSFFHSFSCCMIAIILTFLSCVLVVANAFSDPIEFGQQLKISYSYCI